LSPGRAPPAGASAQLRWHKGRCCFQQCFVTNFYDSSTSPPAKHPTLQHRRRTEETKKTEIDPLQSSQTPLATDRFQARWLTLADPNLPLGASSSATALDAFADAGAHALVTAPSDPLRRRGPPLATRPALHPGPGKPPLTPARPPPRQRPHPRLSPSVPVGSRAALATRLPAMVTSGRSQPPVRSVGFPTPIPPYKRLCKNFFWQRDIHALRLLRKLLRNAQM
jgi:hypothetical protein